MHLIAEIDFFLSLNHSSSALEFYRLYFNKYMVCTCKLAKAYYVRNTSRISYQECGSVISVKNGLYRSETASILSTKIL